MSHRYTHTRSRERKKKRENSRKGKQVNLCNFRRKRFRCASKNDKWRRKKLFSNRFKPFVSNGLSKATASNLNLLEILSLTKCRNNSSKYGQFQLNEVCMCGWVIEYMSVPSATGHCSCLWPTFIWSRFSFRFAKLLTDGALKKICIWFVFLSGLCHLCSYSLTCQMFYTPKHIHQHKIKEKISKNTSLKMSCQRSAREMIFNENTNAAQCINYNLNDV